ncbi:helix-turn-helix transcriptional regulator [Nocardioides pacificus]
MRSSRLVGRDAELELLSSTLGIRASGRVGRVPVGAVLLGGDAGVGKTRLLTELRDRAVGEGWQVVAGHCLDFADSALPYLPFSEILGRLHDELPAVVERVVAEHPALARLQPGRRMLNVSDGEDGALLERGDLFPAVHTLLEEAAAEAPLLLVVEDAHWADRSTRDLLSFLFARGLGRPGSTVGLVASYRSDDLHRRHPLRRQVAEWSRMAGVERIQLEALAARDVRRLVHELHPDPLREADVADIVARSEGNAFFVEELVGATWASGGGGLPEDLVDVLLVRLDRLEDGARTVVRTASVAGRRVSHELLAEASGLPPSALEEALRAAVEMNVLVAVSGDAYAFRHALLGEAVYDDLLPGERVRLHAAYAAALCEQRASGSAAELARHARLGQDVRTALTASIRAGEEAMSVGGPEEAAQHFQQALVLLTDPGIGEDGARDVAGLVRQTSDALMAAGHVARAINVIREQLDRLPPEAGPGPRAEMMAALSFGLLITDGDDDDPLEISRRAVELVAGTADKSRARVLGNHARILEGYRHREEARQVALEALALTEKLAMPRLGSDVRTTLIGIDKHGPVDQVRDAFEEVIGRAHAAGAVNAELRGLYLLGRLHQDRGEFDEARLVFQRAARRGADAGTPWAPYAFESRFMLGSVLRAAGRWDEVLELTGVADQAPPPLYEAMLAALRATVLAARGDDTALELARTARPFWSAEGLVAITGSSAELEVHERRGDHGAALAVYDEACELLAGMWGQSFQARLRLSATALGVLAAAAPRLSAEERRTRALDAERLLEDGRRVFAYQRESGITFGPETWAWHSRLNAEALRWRWVAQVDPPTGEEVLAGWRDVERHFAEYGDVLELAKVRTRLAEIMRATGDAVTAREAADLARSAARDLGARPLLDELTSMGSAARPVATVGELTAREGEILALVAEGRTNGEIGKQLFISTKTVSVHVSNILGKLGAAGRTEAAAIARRTGLLG